MRKVSKRAPPEFVAVAIALAQQNRRRGIAIRDPLNVHGQLESLRFKRVKQKIVKLHGKPNQHPGRFTIQNQRVSPKTSGYYSRALSAWKQSWQLASAATDVRGKALADRAVGELAFMYARLGRMADLDALLASLRGRGFTGPATERITGAGEGLATMRASPEIAFK